MSAAYPLGSRFEELLVDADNLKIMGAGFRHLVLGCIQVPQVVQRVGQIGAVAVRVLLGYVTPNATRFLAYLDVNTGTS
jgi:hypothetical protein